MVPVSRRVSAADIRFSVIPLPPRDRLSSRSAHRPNGRTQTGLPRSARTSCDRGGCPLCPEDDGGSSRTEARSQATPAAPPRLVPKPRHSIPPYEAPLHEASNRGSSHSPVRSSPRPPRRDGTGNASASPELRTPPLPAAHVRGGDRPSSTDLELLDPIRLILQSGSSLVSCDFASHRAEQGGLWRNVEVAGRVRSKACDFSPSGRTGFSRPRAEAARGLAPCSSLANPAAVRQLPGEMSSTALVTAMRGLHSTGNRTSSSSSIAPAMLA